MIRVSDLSGAWLDYWVARAECIPAHHLQVIKIQRSEEFHCVRIMLRGTRYMVNYSTSWNLAGPIIERERISVVAGMPGMWGAFRQAPGADGGYHSRGDTYLLAAMRCYVSSMFGQEVPEVTP